MNLDQDSLLYEGKAKRVFRAKDQNTVLVEFKNDATAFNALKKDSIEDKGRLNCQISACLFEILQKEGVPTHYLGLTDEKRMLVQHVKIIPIEVVIRNIAAGSLCRETPIEFGTKLSPALLDLYYKDDTLGDPLLTPGRIKQIGLVNENQLKEVDLLARKVNSILIPFFEKVDLLLIDFKLELGWNNFGELIVADEISPDTCRIWDKLINDPQDRILDKDRFRQDLGGIIEAYREILKRVQGVCPKPRRYK